MNKTNKKKLSLSTASIKQLTETTGGATVCTFGSTAKEPTVATCLSCPSWCPCTAYPCI